MQPSARRTEAIEWSAGVLRVRVQAPPIEGRANKAVIELLADLLDVPKSRIELIVGRGGREKVAEVAGLGDREIDERLRRRLPVVADLGSRRTGDESSGL